MGAVIFGDRDSGGSAVDRRGGSEDDSANSDATAGFKESNGAKDILSRVRYRVFDRFRRADVGGEVDDDVDAIEQIVRRLEDGALAGENDAASLRWGGCGQEWSTVDWHD